MSWSLPRAASRPRDPSWLASAPAKAQRGHESPEGIRGRIGADYPGARDGVHHEDLCGSRQATSDGGYRPGRLISSATERRIGSLRKGAVSHGSAPGSSETPGRHWLCIQKLHFLQMACEKVCKAHLCLQPGADPKDYQSSHAYTAKNLGIIVKQQLALTPSPPKNAADLPIRANPNTGPYSLDMGEKYLPSDLAARHGSRPFVVKYPDVNPLE